jgi:hypothetical protein
VSGDGCLWAAALMQRAITFYQLFFVVETIWCSIKSISFADLFNDSKIYFLSSDG